MAGMDPLRKVASFIVRRIVGTVTGADFITNSGREQTAAKKVELCKEKITQIKALTHSSTIQLNEAPAVHIACSIETALNQRMKEFHVVVDTFNNLCEDIDEVPRVFRFMTRKSALTELDAVLADLRELRLGIENLVMHWSSRVDL